MTDEDTTGTIDEDLAEELRDGVNRSERPHVKMMMRRMQRANTREKWGIKADTKRQIVATLIRAGRRDLAGIVVAELLVER